MKYRQLSSITLVYIAHKNKQCFIFFVYCLKKGAKLITALIVVLLVVSRSKTLISEFDDDYAVILKMFSILDVLHGCVVQIHK